MNRKIYYTSAADGFTSALPVGNGSLGAMVYGGVPREKLTLNIDTLWSGGPTPVRDIEPKKLQSVRSHIFNGDFIEAEKEIEENLLNHYNQSYMPLGILTYQFNGLETQNLTGYSRELDLETALAVTEFTDKGNRIRSQVFSSYPDKLLCLRLSASESASLDVSFGLSGKLRSKTYFTEDRALVLECTAPSHVSPNYVDDEEPIRYDDGASGMKAVCMLRLQIEQGEVVREGEVLRVKGASRISALLTAATGYRGFGKPLEADVSLLKKECEAVIKAALIYGERELLKRHLEDYQALFNRVDFVLETKQSKNEHALLPANERLAKFREGAEDLELLSLYFQFNRYLMIASSRKGSQPSNLQGIWSESVRPVWSSNWTININTQMNYWMADPCNLGDCFEPLQKMVEELGKSGSETASRQYGCRGWAANHNADIWRQSTAVSGLAKYAYWPMGGVWLSTQLFQHYLFTDDKNYLREIFETLSGAAIFCFDWLVEAKDGILHTAPSTSPENAFKTKDGRDCSVSMSSTLDISLIKQLFTYYEQACAVLDERGGLIDEVQKSLKRLPDFKIGRHGQLQEWFWDFEESDAGHRHFSPLYALHPGDLIDRYAQPELAKACGTFIKRRLEHGNGHIGWSCAWLISLFARLGEAEKAYTYLKQLLKQSTYDNFFDLHPPLGESAGEREVFQIDGNFGSAAGVCELLLQSRQGELEFLPALPEEWQSGHITGLISEGGFRVDIWWDGGLLVKAIIYSQKDKELRVRYRRPLVICDGDSRQNKKNADDGILFCEMKAGGTYMFKCSSEI